MGLAGRSHRERAGRLGAAVVLLWIFRPRHASLRDVLRVVPDVVRLLRRLLADGSGPLGVPVVLVACSCG
jgi:hypothetical protein